MAVPATGSLSLKKLAKEKNFDDYNSNGSISGAISLRDVTLGGSVNSSLTYDVTNAISPEHPDNDAGYGMNEFYSYDHDFAAPVCNLAYRSGENGEFNYPVNLGTATGVIRIDYEAFSVPDRFEFTWNGNTYISGSSSGNYDGYVGLSNQTQDLRAALGNNTVEVYSNNQGGIYTGGRGYIEFNKNTSASTANMNVKAPIQGTGWWFSVSCPGVQVIADNPGITPTVTAITQSVNISSLSMTGNVTSKGLASDFTTEGTISAKGFAVMLGQTNTSQFIVGDTGVTDVPEDDSTIDVTGAFYESVSSTPSTNGTVTTNDASLPTTYNFYGSLTKSSLGTTPNSFRAYATNAAGTTYSSIVNVNTTGVSDESGIIWNNQSYTYPPAIANYSSGNIAAGTGSQWNQLQGVSTTTGTITSSISENQVPLIASNTYRYKAVMRQGSTIHYGAQKTFTVPASYDFSATITVRSDQIYSTYAYGYGSSVNYFPTMGSMTSYIFKSKTITGVYFMDQSSTDYLYIKFSTAKPSFSNLVINGTSYGASSTWQSAGTLEWRKVVTSNPMGTQYGYATLNMSN
tara:strand:- start:662 stop:2377 length:1716 start_codon:yes stop_codon:yes gene_type:complete